MKEIKLYVVRCFMEGCEECGNENHIVGVFSTIKLAEQAEERHKQYKHLHYFNTDIDIVKLDEYMKYYNES